MKLPILKLFPSVIHDMSSSSSLDSTSTDAIPLCCLNGVFHIVCVCVCAACDSLFNVHFQASGMNFLCQRKINTHNFRYLCAITGSGVHAIATWKILSYMEYIYLFFWRLSGVSRRVCALCPVPLLIPFESFNNLSDSRREARPNKSISLDTFMKIWNSESRRWEKKQNWRNQRSVTQPDETTDAVSKNTEQKMCA